MSSEGKKQGNIRWFVLTISVLVIFVALFIICLFLGPCGGSLMNGVPMKCHWAYLAAAFTSLFGILAGLGMLRLPGVHGRRFAGILAALAGILCAAFPLVIIGTCATHSCAFWRWPVLVLGLLAVLCGILAWFWCQPKKPSRGL